MLLQNPNKTDIASLGTAGTRNLRLPLALARLFGALPCDSFANLRQLVTEPNTSGTFSAKLCRTGWDFAKASHAILDSKSIIRVVGLLVLAGIRAELPVSV